MFKHIKVNQYAYSLQMFNRLQDFKNNIVSYTIKEKIHFSILH